MGTIMQDLTVAERISNKFDNLTRAERQLANAMLANYPISGLGSITAVAEVANVSSPTVARMAKKLEFGGFPEMQKSLLAELEAKIANPITKHDRWSENAPDTHILNRFADVVANNLHQTLQHIDPATFDAVVQLLLDGDRVVHLAGGRTTRSHADYLFSHLQMLRDRLVHIPPNSNVWPHYVMNMRQGDVLIIFDIRRYEHDLIRLSEIVHAKDISIILFTDQWGSPITRLATQSFHCHVEVQSAWDSSVVFMFIIEALLAAMQGEKWEDTKGRMEKLDDLFDQMEMFNKFT